ncbi:MAG: hypothetical protein CML05_03695 [Pseudozobellia sp.]|nr:hypothetical protein [Pseudozobellia sp.]|tara:strand:+ start:345 stop:2537 length:2193 start_codon:yes stop_codon:yes gene_type:complete
MVTVSAQNYHYAIDEKPIPESQQREADNDLVRIIPLAFDWQNIPEDYSNSIWEIRYDFDLAGQSIILPENVTIRFNGGVLGNGTLRGDQSIIETKTENQIFDDLDLKGSFGNEYLRPQWFGAAMTVSTDDREEFVETLLQAENIGAKILVDKDMFLDLEEEGVKSIFLEDNTWIEGVEGVNIILNNLLSPAFYIALTKNITIKNITFLWDNSYDADSTYDSSTPNMLQLKDYLTNTKGLVYESGNPVTRGFNSYKAILSIEAGQNVTLENVMFKAKGTNANSFIPWAIKLKEQHNPMQVVINEVIAPTNIPRNITLKNVTMDGVLMAIQGVVDGLKSEGLKSYRYSDWQDADGSSIGDYNGKSYDFPPPHLIYLNHDDTTKGFYSKNIEILNTIDYGEYVGTPNVRPTTSGYCSSLSLTGTPENVIVDNYRSYRRDGFLGTQDMSNSIIKNVYSEYDSSIFDPENVFNNIRFTGNLNNVSFENVIIKDIAEVSKYYPLDVTTGDYVTMDNVNVYVNELNTEEHGCFGVSGANNKIINSTLNIKKHSTLKNNVGTIHHNRDALDNGANNYYEVIVNGWRDIQSDPLRKRNIMYFANSDNVNTNYAKLIDSDNNMVVEQQNNVKKEIWTRREKVILEKGTSKILDINIPNSFAIDKITVKIIENLLPSINLSIGTREDSKFDLMESVPLIKSEKTNILAETSSINSNRPVILFADKDFGNTGQIEIILELVR